MSKVTLTFDEVEGIYIEEGEGLRRSKKYVNVEDLRSILMEHMRLETGILPDFCKYYLNTDGKTIMVLQTPAKKREILYHGRGSRSVEEMTVPFPHVIFGVCLEGSTVRQVLIYASKTPIVNNDTRLARFPFGNVWEDGRVCWGNTSIPSINNINQAITVPNLFFQAPFNGDLSENAFRGYSSSNDLTNLLRSLRNEDYFDTRILHDSITVGELIDRLARS